MIFMALNPLTEVQTKLIIETAKQITQFINYSATHPDAITEHRKSGIIIHIYSDAFTWMHPTYQSHRHEAELKDILSQDQNPTQRYKKCP